MSEPNVRIYTSGDQLPEGLMEHDFFHSPRLFLLCQQTPRLRPYMVTVQYKGRILAQLLCMVRRRSSWMPPYLYRHCLIQGIGCYNSSDDDDAMTVNELFALMLHAITDHLKRSVLYLEVKHLSQKMFGYRVFRDEGYFPVRWMSIHNSLHSHTPEERISERMQRRIDTAYKRGIVTDDVKSHEDFEEFIRLLKQHNRLKPKRYIPDWQFFQGILENGDGRLHLTRYHGHIIGCSAVVYSQRQAFLWYAAYRRKSYAYVSPDVLTIWHAIKDAHSRHYEHIFFMDVGLPFRKNSFRDFILRFGGKPTSTYRWFFCTIGWINRLLSWIYRD